MNLTPDEFERMQYLLGIERFRHPLGAEEAAELRSLLAKEDPVTKDFDWEGLIRFGTLVVGVTHLLRILSARAAPP